MDHNQAKGRVMGKPRLPLPSPPKLRYNEPDFGQGTHSRPGRNTDGSALFAAALPFCSCGEVRLGALDLVWVGDASHSPAVASDSRRPARLTLLAA